MTEKASTEDIKAPLVSIGCPVYNGESFVRQALDSLVAQSYGNLEIVISDNASTDATREICLEYAARDQRIRYYRNAHNIGMSANIRCVFELSSGDYFMLASADDIKPPTAVQDCLEALLRDDRAVMTHGAVLVKAEGQKDLSEISNEMDISDLAAAGRIRAFTKGIRHNAMIYGLYRRCALTKATYGNGYGQDYLFCLQMPLLGPVEYISTPMIIYRERKPVPSENPMYVDVPITAMNLLRQSGGAGRKKCWKVLLMGCYYLLKARGVGLKDRVAAIIAHVSTFCIRYRTRLAKEIMFQLFTPASWICFLSWNLARRSSVSMRLARKLQALLT